LVNTLGDLYGSNEDKLVDFFNTFLALLNNRIEILPNEINHENNSAAKYLLEGQLASVEYLADVIENYLESM